MNLKHFAGLALAALLSIGSIAVVEAQVTLPQVQKILPTDLFQDVVNGTPTAQNQYASSLLLAGYGNSLPSRGNALIGGDATTNLWQRSTSGASVTTTTTYGGPDRFAYWSGTSTAMTVGRTSTAADLPASGFQYGFKMARTSGQTGVVPVCMAQAVESANSYQFAGATAELSFYATAGSNFSAASSNMTAYIVYGTGSDEGVAKLAYGINAGGGGGSAWTGKANATAAVITISANNGRYAAVGTIPATATEVGIALCFTPVGTASTNDYIAFSGVQLVRNSSLASAVSTTAGYSCSDIQCTGFDRRSQAIETVLQQRYFYKLTETATVSPIAPCVAIDTTHTNCLIALPVTMRIAPTGTFANGFATPTSTTQATLGACTTLAAATTVTSTVGSTAAYLVNCTATTIPAAGVASFLYTNSGSGTISLASEL